MPYHYLRELERQEPRMSVAKPAAAFELRFSGVIGPCRRLVRCVGVWLSTPTLPNDRVSATIADSRVFVTCDGGRTHEVTPLRPGRAVHLDSG